jgi:hypothetical protein
VHLKIGIRTLENFNAKAQRPQSAKRRNKKEEEKKE